MQIIRSVECVLRSFSSSDCPDSFDSPDSSNSSDSTGYSTNNNNNNNQLQKSSEKMLDAQRHELAMQHGAKMAELKMQRERLEQERAAAAKRVEAGVKIYDDDDDALDGMLSHIRDRRSPKPLNRGNGNR